MLATDNVATAQDGESIPEEMIQAPLEIPPIPDEFLDAAFMQYVSPDLLVEAFDSLDSGLMTDVALQLAEGERVLLREHAAGGAMDMFALALKVATEHDDKASLERIAKAAEIHGNKELAGQVAVASKVAGASRAADDSPKLSAAQTSPDEFAAYADLLQSIKAAGLLGDVEALQEFEGNVDSFEGLTDAQKAFLKKTAIETREGAAASGADQNRIAATMRKLESTTRGRNTAQIIGQVFNYLGQLSHRPVHTHGGHNNFGHNNHGHNNHGHNNHHGNVTHHNGGHFRHGHGGSHFRHGGSGYYRSHNHHSGYNRGGFHGSTQFYHGGNRYRHGGTQFYHGSTQFYHGGNRFYHGGSRFYHGNSGFRFGP